MGQAEKNAFKRFLRGAVSLLITGTVAYSAEKPYLLALTPVINALGKWLRERFGVKNTPI